MKLSKQKDRNSVHGKKKYAAGHMDRLIQIAAGPQQKLSVRMQDWILSFT